MILRIQEQHTLKGQEHVQELLDGRVQDPCKTKDILAGEYRQPDRGYDMQRSADHVRVSRVAVSGLLTAMENEWQKIVPFHPFEASYLRDDLNSPYRSEANQAFLIRGACYLAVVVACLGLIGLVASSAEQRTKEIGVRKVLGSSVVGILSLVIQKFVILVAIANLVACPIAYYALSKWLENFVYKIVLDWELFMLTFVLTVGIAVLAVSTQAIRAARANPVEALRYE